MRASGTATRLAWVLAAYVTVCWAFAVTGHLVPAARDSGAGEWLRATAHDLTVPAYALVRPVTGEGAAEVAGPMTAALLNAALAAGLTLAAARRGSRTS